MNDICTTNELPRLLSKRETAKYLGISMSSVKRYISDGRLKSVRLGTAQTSLCRIPETSIKEFLNM